MNNHVFEKALNASFDDFEDALQYLSAIEDSCELIVTRNEKEFKSAMIPVMNPENYIKSLQKQTPDHSSHICSLRLSPSNSA